MVFGRLAQLVEHALDVRRVSGSSPLSSTIFPSCHCDGRLAQLVEHALDVRRVSGSSPLSSTNLKPGLPTELGFYFISTNKLPAFFKKTVDK